MNKPSKPAKKLSLKRETLRNLLESELRNVVGGGLGCAPSRITAGCSTATWGKCMGSAFEAYCEE